MACTIRGSRFATLGVALLMAALCALFLTEPSRPAYAQSVETSELNSFTISGITRSEVLRVCLGSETQSEWRRLLQFATTDENVGARLAKELLVRGRFACVDTTADELALAGFAVEPTGRVQFQLRIEDLPEDADGSIETMDALTGETKVQRAAIALPAFLSRAKPTEPR